MSPSSLCECEWLPEFGTSQDGENEKICQDIDNSTGEDDETKPLSWREARKSENRKTGTNDDIRENDPSPLLLTTLYPCRPSLLARVLRASHCKYQMNHRINRHSDANIRRGRGNNIHGNI